MRNHLGTRIIIEENIRDDFPKICTVEAKGTFEFEQEGYFCDTCVVYLCKTCS